MKIFIHHANMVHSTNQDTNTNQIKTKKQSQLADRKHLKLNSNLDTHLAHNALGKAKPKYSWQYFTISIFLVVKSFMKNLLMTKSIVLLTCYHQQYAN